MSKREATTTSFKKGKVTNPAGRPKGAYSPLRQQLMALRKMAAENAAEAYAKLWADYQSGDPLSKQIMFKELLSVPTEWLNEVNTSNVPQKIKSINDVNHVLAALINSLLEAGSISAEEVHKLIKTLNSIKFTEQFGKQANMLDKLTEEQLNTIVKWTEEAEEV